MSFTIVVYVPSAKLLSVLLCRYVLGRTIIMTVWWTAPRMTVCVGGGGGEDCLCFRFILLSCYLSSYDHPVLIKNSKQQYDL